MQKSTPTEIEIDVELARRKLGLFFRLGFSLNQVLGEATKARAKTKTKVFEKEREFELREIAIATPPEIAGSLVVP